MSDEVQVTPEETVVVKSTRVVLDKKYLPAVDAMVERMETAVLVNIFLCDCKKEEVLEFLLHDTMPTKLSNTQIITRLYHGTKLDYGKATDRKRIVIEGKPSMTQALFEEVPEEEYTVVVKATRATGTNKAIKNALRPVVLSLHASNFELDAIVNFVGIKGILTREEVGAIVSGNELPGTTDAALAKAEAEGKFPKNEAGIYTGDAGIVIPDVQPVVAKEVLVEKDTLPF